MDSQEIQDKLQVFWETYLEAEEQREKVYQLLAKKGRLNQAKILIYSRAKDYTNIEALGEDPTSVQALTEAYLEAEAERRKVYKLLAQEGCLKQSLVLAGGTAIADQAITALIEDLTTEADKPIFRNE